MGYQLTAEQREFLRLEEGVVAPAKEIAAIVSHFERAAETLKGANDGDLFELKEIVHHQKQDMQCLCGRAIKHMYVVSHVALRVELGLGSECFKYFFPDLTALKMNHKLEAFEGFCSEIEQAMDKGSHATDPETLLLKEWQQLSPKQLRRLEFGLPLTQNEKHLLLEKLAVLKSFLNKEKKELAHKLLKPYKHAVDQAAFQYVMGLLEDGRPIRALEDLKAIPLEELQKRLDVHMTKQSSGIERVGAATKSPTIDITSVKEVEAALSAIVSKQTSLSPRAQANLSALLDNLENAKKFDHDAYVSCLLSTETRLNLNNMVNQLNLPYSLLK